MSKELAGPIQNPERLVELESFGVLDTPPDADFDRLTRLAARILHAPVSLVSLVTDRRQFFKSCIGLPDPWATARETPLSHSFCRHVVETASPLVIEDARTHPLVRDNLAVSEIGVVAYLGIPLVSQRGHALGSFCVIDTKPRAWTSEEIETLTDLAASVMTELELNRKVIEQQGHENDLIEARSLLESLLEAGDVGTWTWDLATDDVVIDENVARIFGMTPEQPRRGPLQFVLDLIHPEDHAGIAERVGRAIESEDHYDAEYRVVRPGGEVRWLVARGNVRRDEAGNAVQLPGIVVDITDQKRLQDQLRDTQERLQYALSVGSAATFTWDIDSDRVTADPNLARFYGLPPGACEGGPVAPYLEAIHPDDKPRMARELSEAIAHGTLYDVEHRIPLPDGRVRWLLSRGSVDRDAVGKARRMVGIVIDTTERKRGEQAIERSESRLRAFVTASADAVYRMSPDWSEMNQLVGHEFIADTDDSDTNWMERYIAAEDRDRVGQAIAEAVRTKSVFELEHRVRRVDGSLGWTSSRAVPIIDEHGDVVEWFGTAGDITERSEAEAALRESEERYRTLFRSIDEGLCVIQIIRDASGKATDWRYLETNPAFEEQSGVRDAVGKRVREMFPDHDEFWFETYGRVAETGESARFQYASDSMQGDAFDLFAFRIGEPDEGKVAVLFTNITHRRKNEAERERLVRELTENDRRRNEFLAMLAHELRNPLAAISNAAILLERVGDLEQAALTREIIKRQVGTLGRLVDDLLDVSRVSQGKVTLKKSTLELGPIISVARELAEPLIKQKRHTLTVKLSEPGLRFEGDKTRVEQVLGNILTNAAKYTEPGGHIELSAGAEGRDVVLVIKDDGVGIAPEMLPEVFGLFTQVDSTIDRSQGGLGIGLTLVRSLVEMHGGRVSAESGGRGKGSTFTVRLPIGKPESAKPQRESRPSARLRNRILVVDDNQDVARLTARLLVQSGYTVKTAFDGVEAIEVARNFEPEAVLLDIGLPGMNGYDVAATLKQHECCRQARIIALTGYGEEAAVSRAREAGFDHHLTKPIDFARLTDLIES